MMKDKEYFMKKAIAAAKRAEAKDEVPVGAVIVKDGEIIASAGNRKERENCAVFHAEIVAIHRACKKLGNWYLDGCEMYVTLEPCPMCAGAIINSRPDKLYFGAYDPKAGCAGSLYDLLGDGRFNHTLEVEGGILKEDCAALLSGYFKKKRESKKLEKQKGEKKC